MKRIGRLRFFREAQPGIAFRVFQRLFRCSLFDMRGGF
mgnify:CR=1 FL=1